jgi:hypothetical protein
MSETVCIHGRTINLLYVVKLIIVAENHTTAKVLCKVCQHSILEKEINQLRTI